MKVETKKYFIIKVPKFSTSDHSTHAF